MLGHFFVVITRFSGARPDPLAGSGVNARLVSEALAKDGSKDKRVFEEIL
jgi:hypothetical protein